MNILKPPAKKKNAISLTALYCLIFALAIFLNPRLKIWAVYFYCAVRVTCNQLFSF
ncbi:hypothetical protein HAINFHK1212_0851 [Haemophilus influenzae HK1212]|uniref:Uncharacterized protein n=1 Tax=Haemophilus influenzae HK1212 TaxID=456482 RepID=A0A7G2K0R0_HAEIF|nr:hypothetical protein HAINFHK1212_0851 [Haemophilus influenzae HK1212]